MATMVLTAVGTVVGGPIGGAIGALIGNVIDNEILFKPKGRQGARLADLQIQTSSYGTQIPRLFGTIRVAGTVIWATDLKESRSKSGGGKGRPSVTSYSYSASFAVALSARRVRAVRRIWADGNLLRGAGGDFKTGVGAFRLHDGGDGQAVDPLIAAAQGIGQTPAHRGIAYALFEDLQLADYGNRIPSLTFEVEADDGAVGIATIAEVLSEGRIGGADLPVLDGFAASGADVRDAIAPLVDVYALALRAEGDGVRLEAAGGGDPVPLARAMLAARANGRAVDAIEQSGGAADAVPVAISLRHHDAARDYQAGVQRVTRPGPGRAERGIELPAVLSADAARALAAAQLGAAWSGRATMTVRADWRALGIAPGAIVTVPDVPGRWRVEEREWEAMVVRLALRRVPGAGGVLPAGASSGLPVRQVDAPHGPTTLMLADLPMIGDGVASAPVIVAAASGGAGWRGAALFLTAAGSEARAIGPAAGRAVMGTTDAALAEGSAMVEDRRGILSVTLLAPDMELLPSDEAGLARGRNLCLVGRELIQFAMAERTGPASYRLTELRRGLRGTEWAMAGHGAGEPFLLIEADRLVEPVRGGEAEAGGSVAVAAIGIGDATPAQAALTVSGEAVRPPSPVHVTVRRDGAGGQAIGWTRRSRAGWRWLSGTDVPMGEEAERYRIEVIDGGVPVRTAETGGPAWTYDAAMIAQDGTAGRAVTIAVRQLGTVAAGRAATLTIVA